MTPYNTKNDNRSTLIVDIQEMFEKIYIYLAYRNALGESFFFLRNLRTYKIEGYDREGSAG